MKSGCAEFLPSSTGRDQLKPWLSGGKAGNDMAK